MFKKYVTLVLAIALMPMMLSAQESLKKAPIKFDQGTAVENTVNGQTVTPQTAANYVLADFMSNSYGPAIGALNPLVFDPYANVVALVHRGSAVYSASGALNWNISTDNGATWTRSLTTVQNGLAPNNARYPSMALANPTHGSAVTDVNAVFSWPQLTPAAFGFLGYGISQDLASADFAAEDQGPPTYSSQVPTWASDNTPWVFWSSDNTDNAGNTLFKTSDWTQIDKIEVPEWNSAVFGDNGNATLGGASYNGVQYYGMIGSFDETVVPGAFTGTGGWGIGYSKSTDDGATWSVFNVVDWTKIPVTERFNELWDYVKNDGFVGYQGDINVDKNGYVHLVTGLTDIDTLISDEYGYNALVEFFETASGWDAKIIVEGDALLDSTFTQFDGPALGQMGYSVYLATNKDRDVFVAQYVTSGTPGDSLCDIFMASRTLDGNWSASMNLTQTPGMNENGSHLAPMLAGSGTEFTAYSGYFYESGYTGHNPNVAAQTDFFVAAVPVTITGVEDEISANYSFNLSQNYPNPFNPTTSINFTVPENGFVSLKVYDVLGNEVATLVNQSMTVGSHNVNFDAANFASGMYIYKMQAGNFQSVKKMMLLK